MGGGPFNISPNRTTCVLTFPKETNHNPIRLDAVYLCAVGLRLVKAIGRELLGRKRAFGVIYQQDQQFISLCTEEALKEHVKAAVGEREMYLNVIFVSKTLSGTSVDVCPSIDRNFSPEPVSEETNEEYVVLPRPTFYISDSWHLQAEQMSMSLSSSSSNFTNFPAADSSFILVSNPES